LPKPARQSGESIARLLKNPNASFDQPAYAVTVYGKSFARSIRTSKWHYVEWDDGKSGNMLYAIEDDPHELKNLSNDPKYAKTVEEMKKLLSRMP
jgi:arylsulfatase A-like enzyme